MVSKLDGHQVMKLAERHLAYAKQSEEMLHDQLKANQDQLKANKAQLKAIVSQVKATKAQLKATEVQLGATRHEVNAAEFFLGETREKLQMINVDGDDGTPSFGGNGKKKVSLSPENGHGKKARSDGEMRLRPLRHLLHLRMRQYPMTTIMLWNKCCLKGRDWPRSMASTAPAKTTLIFRTVATILLLGQKAVRGRAGL